MAKLRPAFLVSTGDSVCYDQDGRVLHEEVDP